MGSVPFFFFFFKKKNKKKQPGWVSGEKERKKKKSVPGLLKKGALVGFLTAHGSVDVMK